LVFIFCIGFLMIALTFVKPYPWFLLTGKGGNNTRQTYFTFPGIDCKIQRSGRWKQKHGRLECDRSRNEGFA